MNSIVHSRWSARNDKSGRIFLMLVLGAFFLLRALGLHAQEEVSSQEGVSLQEEVPSQEGGALPDDVSPAEEAVSSQEEDEAPPVEINGDQVEFSMKENKAIASGNVSVQKGDVTLLCDRLEYFRDTQLAFAEGHVVLIRNNGRLTGDKMKFNFGTMKGDFFDAKIASKPFFGRGTKMSKVGENHLRMDNGRITTCDLDKPHFEFVSKKIDIYPGEKAVARNVRLLVGRLPLLFIPRFTQDLRDKEPVVIYTPGYDKEWGAFVLSNWRYRLSENLKGIVHLDYRQKKDFAWGIDLQYKTPHFGEGLIRTYYMNERNVTSKYFFEERPTPTIERERFRVQWRHKWNIDNKTSAIWQYYKLSDSALLKDYFEREHDDESSPKSYFLLTRGLPLGTLSYRADVRVNRFETMVERLPEINWDVPNTKIGETGFYLNNSTTYSNLTYKVASPSEERKETMRIDTGSTLSYPLKLGFIEMKPYAGGRQTYYSKTKDNSRYGVIRGFFFTGADLSTKFYRIFDVSTDKLGLNINRLRHIITPSIAYQYAHDPTIPSSQLDQFDTLDSVARDHSIRFTLEQKLQTKRKAKSADLVRMSVETNFLLKEASGKGGFNAVTSDIEITPYDWMALYFDSSYDTVNDHLSTANVDFYLNDEGSDWYVKFGKRLNVDVDDQITTEFGYTINPKWKFRTYQRFDVSTGIYKEQEYNLRRDLHCWIMDINFNHTRNEGDEIWLVFTLKAFPELGFDFGTSFNRRKPGAGQ